MNRIKLASPERTVYQVGRSSRNTVAVQPLPSGSFQVSYTANGGQYNKTCQDVESALNYLADMQALNMSSLSLAQIHAKVKSKLKLVKGPDILHASA